MAPGTRTPARPAPWVVPSWADPVVATAARVIGGPAGRHAAVGARGLAGVLAALLVMAAGMLSLGTLQKGHCLAHGWTTPAQFWRMCYSDLPVVHMSSALAHRATPWSGTIASDHAPLSGLTMWVIARVSPEVGASVAAQQWVFGIWTLCALLLLAACLLAAVALHPRRPWQAGHLAASPVIITLALVSTDLLAVAASLLGLLAWRRGRPLLAGALLGIAALGRPFPLVLVAALLLVGLRRGARGPALSLVAGVTTVLAVVGLVAAWREPAALRVVTAWGNSGNGALQGVPSLLGLHLPDGTSQWIALTGWLVALAIGTWTTLLRSGHAGDVPLGELQVAALMMIVVVLTTPGLSVQSGLWMLPFLALSARPWWQHLAWALAETLHFGCTWLYLAYGEDPGRGLPPDAYAIAVVLRIAAWVWLLWQVVTEPSRRQAPLAPQVRP